MTTFLLIMLVFHGGVAQAADSPQGPGPILSAAGRKKADSDIDIVKAQIKTLEKSVLALQKNIRAAEVRLKEAR